MALAIGLIIGLFVLLGMALLGAGLRNPRWLVIAALGITALYHYGQDRLSSNLEGIEIIAGQGAACPADHIQVTVSNAGTKTITGFSFSLRGYRPNFSQHIVDQSHRTDRIIPAGQSWANCWEVKDLKGLSQTQQATLLWEVAITSVELSEG